jgi:hypothetical protein
MRRRLLLPALGAAAAGLALYTLGEPLPWLRAHGLQVIREVSVGEGDRLLEAPDTLLVQVHGGEGRERLAGSELLSPRDPLPPHVAGTSATVVILAEDAGEGLRMAARLARAGIRDVAVVRGGVAAWQAAHRRPDTDEARTEGDVAEST